MFSLDIPGFGGLRLEHLVLDYNGTLALDGQLCPGVEPLLAQLAQDLRVHVLTADTHGSVAHLPYAMHILVTGDESQAKLRYVRGLGARVCVCLGNGRNDELMLKEAALGIVAALELLLHPQRLRASLRTGA